MPLIIHGTIGTRDLDLTVVTGANRSLLKRDLFQDEVPRNPGKYSARSQIGTEIRVYGEVTLNTRLNNITCPHTYILADIVVDCILGSDFLKQNHATLDIVDQKIVLRADIPMIMTESSVPLMLGCTVTEN
uniref:Uncharacterized protein n=1 Tax=Cacopsylla melanoneura TaxID=428564 RepID=A0A8D8Z0Q6_9HEMI